MQEDNLSALNDAELLKAFKKMKSTQITNALLIGFLIGVGLYSTVKKGIGFFTFFPLFFVLTLLNQNKKSKINEKYKAYKNEVKLRNLY
ncbi:FUSC family protein [Flavobacterium branchiophilum]|uniref:FUSC family protein n=1 Tax=Flavobacterium branchiophilum (strain FL-15) TaxID=1034807 RepID=G2Z316_FLABF|nr:hypothetical protein [Flavobacterium branchiophilum]CCB70354.1 Hypothetical protein FBFL15_2343 [Flavobacterium branchiophilum FL-15]